MTSEYMNTLYRDLLSNSPQTVTIPIPSDMGTGQIAQVVTKRRVVEYCRQQRGRLSCKGRILHLPWTRENGVSLLCAKQRLLF